VDCQIALGNRDRPEGSVAEAVASVGINRIAKAWIEIMGLGRVRRGKVKLTLEGVQSYQGKGAVVDGTVHALIDPVHEAQVGLP
jgi:hypothetical protein